MLENGLYIVATPIGNLDDISKRALYILQEADVIACEDTRVSKKLFALLKLNSKKPFICYEDHREEKESLKIAEMIKQGKSVALISDAGSPLISDPGYKLVRLCKQNKLNIYVIPGASAVIAALQMSGLPTNRFMFLGFIPNKEKARRDLFEEVQNIDSTLVFYETAPRLIDTLSEMSKVFGLRELAVAREITKVFEECVNGTAEELCAHFSQKPAKGEIVLMVAPPLKNETVIDIKKELLNRFQTMSLKSAVQEVAELSGRKKNEIYALALELKNE